MTLNLQKNNSPIAWTDALEAAGFYASFGNAKTIHEWAGKTGVPLVITGPKYAGKTSLADCIIKVLNGKPSDASEAFSKTEHVSIWQMDFSHLFYEWNGHLRKQTLKFGLEKDASPERIKQVRNDPELVEPGAIWRALTSEHETSYLVIDNFSGPLEDEACDKALAEFIMGQRILVPEANIEIIRRPGCKLKTIIIISSYKDEKTINRGYFYEVLKDQAIWLTIENLDRQRQYDVLNRLVPDLNRQVLRDTILFVEIFNTMPNLDKKVTLGELIDAVKDLEIERVQRLTTENIYELSCMIAKTHEDSNNLDALAEEILKLVRQTKF
jgi:hypothetical protein